MHPSHDQEFAVKNTQKFSVIDIFIVEDLDGDGLSRTFVDAAKNTSQATGADLFDDTVVTEVRRDFSFS